MSDDVDEWCHDLRCQLEAAMAAGKTAVTVTAPIKVMHVVADVIQAHFRNPSRTCVLCGAIRASNELAARLRQQGYGPTEDEWRGDARPSRPRPKR